MTVSTNFTDLTPEQQNFILEFLENNFFPRETFNQKYSAYGLKQVFTRKYFYVTQEQFVEAMCRVGFSVKMSASGNACFNISDRSPYLKIR